MAIPALFAFLFLKTETISMSRQNKEELIIRIKEYLQAAIDAEHTASICFKYAASLIKNGKIKAKFLTFAESAEKNKELLLVKLRNLGVDNFVLEQKCKFCKLSPESFSLIGTLNLALELIAVSIKYYNNLIAQVESRQDKELFKKILKEKNKQRVLLKKEKRFASDEKTKLDFIDTYCIPEIISKLWK